MANYANLKATINANIKANGTEAITGPVLNSVLTAAVNTLGAGYQFMGVATTSTNPGTPDANVFYIAATPGTYTNFGGKTVADGEVAILKYNGTWTKEVTGAATAAQLTQLGQEVVQKADAVSLNLYNESARVTGLLIATTGVLNPNNTSFVTSPFVGIKSGENYYIRFATRSNENVLCWYNSANQYISGEKISTIQAVKTAPSNAAYLRISIYGSALGTMVAEGSDAVAYSAYMQTQILADKVLLNKTQKNELDTQFGLSIMKNELDSLMPKINTFVELDRNSNTARKYSGSIGDAIADCIVTGSGGTYDCDIIGGETYAITHTNPIGDILLTDSSGSVIEVHRMSAIVGGQYNYICRFVAPQNATHVYISGFYDAGLKARVYTIKNGNTIVLHKGNRASWTASDDTIVTPSKDKQIFGVDAHKIICAGTGNVTLSLADLHLSCGVWLNVFYEYLESGRITSIQVAFKKNGTTILTKNISATSESRNYFNVKDWAFVIAHNISHPTNNAIDSITISWVLADNNDSVDIYIYPYAIVDFLIMPTIMFNLEHWQTSGMNRGILSHGLKLIVSGNLPESSEDLQYAKECVNKGLLEYGYYANELAQQGYNLQADTDMKDMPSYIYDRFQAKVSVTKEQHFLGGGAHLIPVKVAEVCKLHDINEFRIYGGNAFSIFTADKQTLAVPTTYLGLYNYYVPNADGVLCYFDHSSSSGAQYDDETYGVIFEKLKGIIENGFCNCVTAQELWTLYRQEFVIDDYD